MSNSTSLRAVVRGRVQGVYFRAFVAGKAKGLELKGYVRNLDNGLEVEVCAEGERAQLERLVGFLKEGPPASAVENVDVSWTAFTGKYRNFSIRY